MGEETNNAGLPKHWTEMLDERTKRHVEYARHYHDNYAHGAPGHLDLMTIAVLARLLDNQQDYGHFAKGE